MNVFRFRDKQRVSPTPSALISLSALFISSLVLMSVSNTVGAESQAAPTWREFQNGGQVTVPASGLAQQWSPESHLAWSAEIPGYGQSTPIVAHEQIVVTSTSGEKKDNYHVISYAEDSGKKLWQRDFTNPSPIANTPMVSRAAPSALATSNGFIAFFEGGLLALISTDGKQLWTKNLVDLYGPIESRFGLSASLEQDAEQVFVWVERSNEPYILAIAKGSGEVKWKTEGVGKTSWASPRLIDVEDGQHLVCSASGMIIGLDPQTGKRLWGFDDINNNSSCTPMPVGEGEFLIGASNGRGETAIGNAAASNGLIEIKRDDDSNWNAGFKWRAEKATSTFGSPVVAGDRALFVNRAGVLYQLDLETGEQVSADRTRAGGIWATPLVSGDRVYLFGHKGTTSVVDWKSGKTLSDNRCWISAGKDTAARRGGSVLYAAALSAKYLILRSGDRLFAIQR